MAKVIRRSTYCDTVTFRRATAATMKIVSIAAVAPTILLLVQCCSGALDVDEKAIDTADRQLRSKFLSKLSGAVSAAFKRNDGCLAAKQQTCASEQVSSNNVLFSQFVQGGGNNIFDKLRKNQTKGTASTQTSSTDPELQAFFNHVATYKNTDGYELDSDLALTSIVFTSLFTPGTYLFAKEAADRLLPDLRTTFPRNGLFKNVNVASFLTVSSSQRASTNDSVLFALSPYATPTLTVALLLTMLVLLIPISIRILEIAIPRLAPCLQLENIEALQKLLPLIYPFIRHDVDNVDVNIDSRKQLLTFESEMQGTFDAVSVMLKDMASNGNNGLLELNCRLKALYCERAASLDRAFEI